MKKIKRIFVVFLSLILIHLVIVAIWASGSIDDLIKSYQANDNFVALSEEQLGFLLKIEDPTFYTHIGVDISNGQGLTTISSSIARDIFLFGEELDGVSGGLQSIYRSIFKCCKKIDLGRDIMAIVLNSHISKEEQLRIYIQNIYLGKDQDKQIIGFKSAAKSYYSKAVNELTNVEFAGLISMIKSPNTFHPINKPEKHKTRQNRIIRILENKCMPEGLFDTSYEICDE